MSVLPTCTAFGTTSLKTKGPLICGRIPEGHIAHLIAATQRPLLCSQALTLSSRRFAAGAAALDGRILRDLQAWGKHLLYAFEGRLVLHIHLGMFGRIRPIGVPLGQGSNRRDPWLVVRGPEYGFELTSPAVCEVLQQSDVTQLLARLGADPIRSDDDGGAYGRLVDREEPIGVALLDQSLVAGVGNVYRAEILFAARIHPEMPACRLEEPQWARIWDLAKRYLRKGVADRGRIVTVPPSACRGQPGRLTWAYSQTWCLGCGGRIRRWALAGRVCYACETCQKARGAPGATDARL